MNVIKSMRIVSILENSVILKDRLDYLYVIIDKPDIEWIKKHKDKNFVIAINHKNKSERYAKILINGKYIKNWVLDYLAGKENNIEEAYKLFIPLVYKYRPLRKWLAEKYGKDIFKNLTKEKLVKKVSTFIKERYCSKEEK